MAICKYCQTKMNWGQINDKWVKLVPIGEDVGMDRTHQDENGVLRAQHKCEGWTAAVQVVKLATPISASDIIGQAAVELSTDTLTTFAECPKPFKTIKKRVKAGVMTTPLKVLKGRKS